MLVVGLVVMVDEYLFPPLLRPVNERRYDWASDETKGQGREGAVSVSLYFL